MLSKPGPAHYRSGRFRRQGAWLMWTVTACSYLFIDWPVISLAASEPRVLEIKVLSGEGVVHRPGSTSNAGLIVQVLDEVGRPVPGATVSFQLPDEGPGGLFANGLRTEILVTDAKGKAELWGLKTNQLPGEFIIRVTAAKGKTRAGTVIRQFIAQPGEPIPAAHVERQGSRKWLWISLISAGLAGGLATALVSKTNQPQPGSALNSQLPAPTPLSSSALRIGQPSITVRAPAP